MSTTIKNNNNNKRRLKQSSSSSFFFFFTGLKDERYCVSERVSEVREVIRVGDRAELLYFKPIRVNDQERAIVSILVAVIRSREDGEDRCDGGVLEKEVFLIALLLYLMRTDDATELIVLQKLLNSLWTVLIARMANTVRNEFDVLPLFVRYTLEGRRLVLFHRVAPHNVAEGSAGGDLRKAVEGIDVRELAQAGSDAAVHAHTVPVGRAVDVGGQGEGVEKELCFVEDFGGVFVLALQAEGHVLPEKPRLVVAPQHNDVLGVGDLQRA